MTCEDINAWGRVPIQQLPRLQQPISLSSGSFLEDMLKEFVANTIQFQEDIRVLTLKLKNKHRQLVTSIEQLRANRSYTPLSPPYKEIPKETVNTVMVRSDIMADETHEEKLDELRDLMVRFEQNTHIHCHDFQISKGRLNLYMENLQKPSLTLEKSVLCDEVHHYEETVVIRHKDVNVIQELLELEEGQESDVENETYDLLDVHKAITTNDDITLMVDISHPPPLSESFHPPPIPLDRSIILQPPFICIISP
ncbi:hypothetical protein PanWU01x14_080160 [Parasponia andersonii]|uniref:Uncharacterized protein n=1 Tax=Parasponia andersonii TaxID=3476 RepID=A0A2P5DBJ1_PARAD|nr:hypothetical protein PanWU01x14_080160 [Parasponia andersonii]